MDLEFTDELRDFQHEVRAVIEERLPADIRTKVERFLTLGKDDYLRWQDILAERGWLVYSWPVEHGGTGWSPVQGYIFEEEMGRARAPRIIPFGPKMVGPVICTFGSDAQKAKYLPAIAANETWWCQGYSEPDAGSDLASLRTRAVRDGDHYVVNGTKTWTTAAHWADMMFCLVRTDTEVKPQEGISFLLLDMRDPGVEVRPIVTMDGGREINTVYLTDVKVPVENRIGEENKGWTYAKFLLGHERFGIARLSESKARLAYLSEIARSHHVGGTLLADDADFMRSVAETEIELTALEFTELRALMNAEQGKAPGVEANMLKIRGTEVQQKISEMLMKAMGYYALPYVPEAMEYGWNEAPIGPEYASGLAPAYFNMRKTTIYGGTNEIQRNIIARMVLGA
ncbi:MAG: acyl-CoA dehydrogenase family protein [Chromatiales bacterium]|nr:acyl-CoA dehydrogenase family protein [Chromatiales bacterium]